MSLICKNLKHVYSEGTSTQTLAIENISFQVEDGDFVGIIGSTGSGKSTLIKHLNGLLKPTDGYIKYGDIVIDKNSNNLSEIRKKIGLVFQYPEKQLFEETVYKDISYGPKNLGLREEEIEKRVLDAATKMDIDKELFDKSPFELSGGQKRRVAIAGVIAMNPEILILDEPTSGLDPLSAESLINLLKEINKSGTTLIMVSHSMDIIYDISNKTMVLDNGKLHMYDDTEKVFLNYRDLLSLGLDVPEIMKVLFELKDRGMKVRTDTNDCSEAYASIMEARNAK